MAGRGPRMTDFEERDYYHAPQRRSEADFREFESRPRVMTRSPPPRERQRDRVPHFLREENQQNESGPMVLRKRDVETWDRHHHHSPSPVRVREERLVRRPRSVSPPRRAPCPPEEERTRSRTRFVERERVRSPSRERKRSPSPRPIRYVDRPRSPSPQTRERIRARIIDRERERSSSSSSSSSEESRRPQPPPEHIRGPTLEREVITHYRDIDHGTSAIQQVPRRFKLTVTGTIKVRPPSPSPQPQPRPRHRHHEHEHERERQRETDIDINLSKNRTEVDIYRGESRSKSRHRHHHDGDLVVYGDSRRRAHSEAPPYRHDDEGREIVSKIDSRGYPGEAWHGATRDWAIVDVPPGTERVRMDGAGGGSTDTQWSKYSGVRRTQFIPERDGQPAPRPRYRSRSRSRDARKSSTSVSSWDREREIEVDIDRTVERHNPPPAPPAPAPKEMWTEISKDLVLKEAIQHMGYEYEDTPMFFYVMSYLRYVSAFMNPLLN